MNGQEPPPVSVGELYNVAVNAVGGKGDGIARVKGFVLFVANTKKGDYVRVKVTKVLQNVGFAEVVEHVERPERQSKFTTVTEDELKAMDEEPDERYEDTEDFGEDLIEE